MTATRTPAETLRAAAALLACDHSYPILPPQGSLARPGDCDRCGTPYGVGSRVADLPDDVAEPIAAWLDAAADDWDGAERTARRWYGDKTTGDHVWDYCDEPDSVRRALTTARALLGEAP